MSIADTPATTRNGIVIAMAYAAQALGYASVMTALPSVEQKWSIDEFIVSLIMLGACLTAAGGSALANVLALRVGTRVTLILALAVQATTIAISTLAPHFPLYVVSLLVYGIGLGLMDVSENAQAVRLEAATGTPLMGRFYATYTGASIVGALLMSAFLASSGAMTSALIVAALFDVVVLVIVVRWLRPIPIGNSAVPMLDRDPDAADDSHARLPRGKIVGIGLIVLAAYMLDSAISSWSSIYLATGLAAAAAVAPLGYAAYQGMVFVTRLTTDRIESSLGRARLGVIGLVIGVAGSVVVALVPTITGAIIGFCISGIATGVLIPLAISAAGNLVPHRRDEVIARVNVFNYGGAILGAVTLGLIAEGRGLGFAFLIPGAALLLFAPYTKLLKQRDPELTPVEVV